MESIESLRVGFAIILSPLNLFYGFMGAFLGTLVGVLPGLGSPATIALLLPLTYKMDPISAVIMLSGIFYGAQYGGSTTSILLNIPGEASSVATCLDGYQMARQGRAGPALGISAIGSFIGGTFGVLALVMIAPGLAAYAIRFGPPEYFSLVLLGLVMAVYLSGESVLKGLLMVATGLFLGTVGLDPAFGMERFTFNITWLSDGLDFVVVCMGLFGISEVLINLEAPETRDIFKSSLKHLLPTLEDWRQSWGPIVRGSLIGIFIGVLPGGGPLISTFASYTVEKRLSKHPESFGKGAIEGVAAPETANNASAMAAFVPLLTLGVPGTASMAMIYAALMIHGIHPGPLMLREHPEMFWGVIASMFTGNVILLGLNLPLIGLWVRLLKVPYRFLVLVIIVICVIGAYSVHYTPFDVGTMVVFGIFGYLMRKHRFPAAPLVLAMILEPIIERSIQQSLMMADGNFLIFVRRPISALLLSAVALLILKALLRRRRNQGGVPFAGGTS